MTDSSLSKEQKAEIFNKTLEYVVDQRELLDCRKLALHLAIKITQTEITAGVNVDVDATVVPLAKEFYEFLKGEEK